MLFIKKILLVAILACSIPLDAKPQPVNVAALQQEHKQLRQAYKLKKEKLKQAKTVQTQTDTLNQHIERENKRFAQKKQQEAAQLKALHKVKKIKKQELKEFLCLTQQAHAEKCRIKEKQDREAARRFIAELERTEAAEQRIAEEQNLQAARRIAAKFAREEALQAAKQRIEQEAAQARQRAQAERQRIEQEQIAQARERSIVLRVARQAQAEEHRIAEEHNLQAARRIAAEFQREETLQAERQRIEQEAQALAEQERQAQERQAQERQAQFQQRQEAEAQRVAQEAGRIREAQARRIQEERAARPRGLLKRFKNALSGLFQSNAPRPTIQPVAARPAQPNQPVQLPVVSRPAGQQTTTTNTIPVSDCCICMESLDTQNITVLHCNHHCRVKHAFHTACLNQHRAHTGLYVNGSNTCPTCRMQIDPLLENKPWNEVVRKLLQLNVTLPDAE